VIKSKEVRVRVSRAVVAAFAVVIAGCSGANAPDSAPPSVSPTIPATSVTSRPSTTTSATTSTTITPTTVVTTTAATSPPVEDGVTLGPPASWLVSARPRDEIDWDEVGPGWLLIDHVEEYNYTDPPTMDQRGLYLVSPDNEVYATSALPTDGSWLVDVSHEGRRAVLQQFDDVCAHGCSSDDPVLEDAYGYVVLDLTTTTLRPVIEPVTQSALEGPLSRRVTFTSDAQGLWVSETWRDTDDWWRLRRVSLGRVDLDDGRWTTVLDEATDLDLLATYADRTDQGHASVLEVADGRIVTESPTGIWLRGPDGAPLRQLDAPDTSCRLDQIWDDEHVVAQCGVPEAADQGCWTTALWLIALDGGPSTLLAAPVDDAGDTSCYTGYYYAESLGEMLAVLESEGDGECPSRVVLLTEDGIRQWEAAIPERCSEYLLGTRNGAWLISVDTPVSAAATYEVTPDEDTLLPLPSGTIKVVGEPADRPT
jgi:hypothetical protein